MTSDNQDRDTKISTLADKHTSLKREVSTLSESFQSLNDEVQEIKQMADEWSSLSRRKRRQIWAICGWLVKYMNYRREF